MIANLAALAADLNGWTNAIDKARRAYAQHLNELEGPPVARCGTTSGHKRHQRRGSKPCAACRAAKSKYDRSRRAMKKASQ